MIIEPLLISLSGNVCVVTQQSEQIVAHVHKLGPDALVIF